MPSGHGGWLNMALYFKLATFLNSVINYMLYEQIGFKLCFTVLACLDKPWLVMTIHRQLKTRIKIQPWVLRGKRGALILILLTVWLNIQFIHGRELNSGLGFVDTTV